MKKLLYGSFILLLLWNPQKAFSQKWRTLKPSGYFIYTENLSNNYQAYRIDSIIKSGNDTIYKSFPVIKHTDNNCYSPYDGSWVGKKVLLCQNGDNIFFNYQNDSIRIKTLANTGDSWSMCDNGNITATLLTIKDTTFLGINDSIKVISLASTIPTLSGKKIILSKHYGLLYLPDFYDFPDNIYTYGNIMFYNLVGMSNPQLGMQNLTLKEVYKYNIGDEYHRHTLNKTDWAYPPYQEEESWSIYSVIDTLPSASADTLKYLFKRCQKIRYYYSVFNDTSYQTITTHNDTIEIKQALNNSEGFCFNKLPNEPCYNSNQISSYQQTVHPSGITGKIAPNEDNTLYNISPCWNYLIVDACVTHNINYKGIFGVDYNCSFYNAYMNSSLVYYKKGNQSWGSPYDCGTILSVEFDKQFALNVLTITPNPATTHFTILIDRYVPIKMSFELYNILGTKVSQQNLTDSKTEINCCSLARGIYLYRIQATSGIVASGKLILE